MAREAGAKVGIAFRRQCDEALSRQAQERHRAELPDLEQRRNATRTPRGSRLAAIGAADADALRLPGHVGDRDLRAQNVHAQPLRDRLGEVAGEQHREAVAAGRIAPEHEIGEHPALGRVVASVAARSGRERVDVARHLALQKSVAASAPVTARMASGSRSQTTAASRAASRARSAARRLPGERQVTAIAVEWVRRAGIAGEFRAKIEC